MIVSFRKTIIVGLLAMAGFIEGCSSTSHPKSTEPTYQGKPLSAWLRDFDNFNLTPEQRAMVPEAIRQMGSAAVPFLVERLSEAQLKETNLQMKKWQERRASAVFLPVQPPNPRREALAALDALGPAAVGALPVLEKWLNHDPPDTQVLYIAARIGPAGVPLLTNSLISENKLVRLQAQICLDMMNSHSVILYPLISTGPDAPSFESRWCRVILLTTQAAAKEYQANHPNGETTDD
ncbi:MAG: hypothetical protein WDN00_03090 [Limisphaerales bacterium]